MSQAIKYESTTVEPEQSAAEIMQLVRAYGGTRFEMIWGDHGLRAGTVLVPMNALWMLSLDLGGE